MSSALSQLEERVFSILRESTKPLTIPEIEAELPRDLNADTFDVRNAVWSLIAQRRAEFTPERRVKGVGR